MNPSLDTPSAETPALGSAPGASTESQQQRDDNPILGKYRGNGKVARLPKNVRDQINQGMAVYGGDVGSEGAITQARVGVTPTPARLPWMPACLKEASVPESQEPLPF